MNPLTTALADHFGRSRRADPIRRNHASRIRPIHASKIPSNHATKIRLIDGSLWPSRDGSDRAVLDTPLDTSFQSSSSDWLPTVHSQRSVLLFLRHFGATPEEPLVPLL